MSANRENGRMKTTLDLPETLVRELRRRASDEGRDVKEVVTDLLRAGLTPSRKAAPRRSQRVPRRLPKIKARPLPPANPAKLGTQEWCDWIKEMETQLDVERHEKALGHQHVDRSDA